MLTIKRKQLTGIIFMVMGFGYFNAMSNLEMHYILKSLIALMPIQGLALIYVTYLHWSRR